LRDIRIAIGEKMAPGWTSFLRETSSALSWHTSKDTLLVLGGIVVIMIVIAYFLAQEIEKISKSRE
jgi:uncharacterized membrane protein